MQIELKYFEIHILDLIIKNIYGKNSQNGKTPLIKFSQNLDGIDLMYTTGFTEVAFSQQAIEDLGNWAKVQKTYYDFSGTDQSSYLQLRDRELSILLMLSLIKKITMGSKKWKALNSTLEQLYLILLLRKCESYLLCSSDLKHRVIHKIIFLSRFDRYFPVSLLLPITLKGKSFESNEKLHLNYTGNPERDKKSRANIIDIMNALPTESKENMGASYTFLKGVIAGI
ncbi:MAG: hypothetical protein AAFY45_34440 [Bacteroidota bacterium]